jgi:hypothetical protein
MLAIWGIKEYIKTGKRADFLWWNINSQMKWIAEISEDICLHRGNVSQLNLAIICRKEQNKKKKKIWIGRHKPTHRWRFAGWMKRTIPEGNFFSRWDQKGNQGWCVMKNPILIRKLLSKSYWYFWQEYADL